MQIVQEMVSIFRGSYSFSLWKRIIICVITIFLNILN